jgi:hypothetical protein
VDMVRRLRRIGAVDGYTATGLLLVEWEDDCSSHSAVTIRDDVVPDDVAPPQFLSTLVQHVLEIAPVTYHVRVRECIQRRDIPVPEADSADIDGYD